MGSLSNLYISQSYQSLIHLGTNNTASATLIGLEDGLGNSIGVSVNTAGNLYLSGTFSASLQEGYIYVGNSSGRTIAFPTSSFITELETGSLLTTASFNAYTASTNIRLSNIETITGSILVSINNLNASSASQQVSINALNVFTASQSTASIVNSITNLNNYTQSNDLKWSDLGTKSGSWITESETGSFARYDVSNPWSADQNFTNISAVSASFTYIKTVFETASVIYSSGSNQFGDELSDVQTLSGSVKIRGGLLVNDLDITGSINSINVFTQSANVRLNNLEAATSSYAISSSVAAVDAAQQLQINSLIAATSSYADSASFAASQLIQDGRLNNLESTSASVNISISNLNQFTASISTASIVNSINELNQFTQSANSRLNNIEAATSSYANSASVAIVDAGQNVRLDNLELFTSSLDQTYVTQAELAAATGALEISIDTKLDTASFNSFTQSYLADSASFDSRIDALESFSSSLDVTFVNQSELAAATGALETSIATKLDTASFNSYTQSNDQKWNDLQPFTASLTASVAELLQLSASLSGGFVTEGELQAATASLINQINTKLDTASFNSYTQSTDNRLNNLELTSQSVNISITNLNNFTASIDTNFVSETEFGVYTASINAFTQSANNRLTSLESATSSYAISASVAAVDAAQQAQIDSLIAATASYADSASFAASQLVQDGRLNNLESTTASLNISVSNINGFTQSANIRLNNLETTSASVNTSITNINAYTQSNDLKWQDLGSKSGSWITESETASFARYDVSNPWSANQNFTNITAFSASFTYVQTTYETASVIYSSGSNQFGDELTDTQTLSGSVLVRGGLFVNDIDITSSLNNINVFTQSADQRLDSLEAATSSYAISASVAAVDAAQQAQIDSLITATSSYADSASFAASQLAQDIRIDGLAALTASVSNSISNLNLFTQSADQRLDSIEAQSGSWVTSAITGSSIITASVSDDDITFTKGDGSTFTIQVATGSFALSASFATSASYAETASYAQFATDIYLQVKNTTGAQLNKGTVVRIIGATGDNALVATASWEDDNNSANTLGFLYENIPNDSFGKVITQGTLLGIDTDPVLGYTAGQLIYLSSSGQYTNVKPPAPYHEVRLGQVLRAQQNNGSVYVLIQNGYELDELHDVDINTGSLANNNLLAYNSASTQWENKTLTQVGATTTASFNAYTSSNDQKVNSLIAATGSYATTGSNTFRGNQSLISSSIDLQGSGQISLPNGFTLAGNAGDIGQITSQTTIQFITEPPAGPGGTNDIKFINRVSGSSIDFSNQQGGAGNSITFGGGSALFDLNIVSGSTGKLIINADGGIDASTSTFTASLQQGYAWVGDFQGISKAVTTSSILAPYLTTASFNAATGAFATTGSNTFIGNETFQDAGGNFSTLVPTSGSLMLVAKTFNSASAHLSASAGNLVNLIFKTNNNTADTILSGSSNIFTNAGAPTAGFKRYLTAGNLSLIGALPQISGNMAFSPTITGNIFAASAATTNPMTIRGPVSSSTYTITSNISAGGALNLGTSAANNFQQAVNGVSIGNNLIGGTFSLVANRTRLTQVVSINGNQIQGVSTFNMNSSSIDLSTSLFYGTNTFNNNSSGSSRVSAAGNAAGIVQSAFIGVNTTTFSGSNDPNDAQDLDYNGGVYRSLIVGSNTPFVLTGPTGSNSLSNTGIIGNSLIVTGSSGNPVFAGITTGHGSLFTGRFNAQDGVRERSSNNIFVVGTGTSTTARKTGFLIDSGSNTFIEGTLNVSGSSTLSGSLYIQSGSTLPASTGSAILTWNAATGQVNQASFSTIVSASVSSAEFSSTVTQSGSAGVSGSLSFNNSGSFYNVSLVNGKEIKVTNGGVYNIQFSAQVETSAGADTVYLWYKKNGNNISDSARKALLANNTAQVVTVSILDEAQANDYYEIGYQTQNGNATILAEAASGNIPGIPSVIATIFQIR